MKITETKYLLLWLATSKSSSELHGGGARASSTSLVSLSGLPVGLSVGLLSHASGPGSTSGPRPGLSGSLSLEGGGDNLRGQVEVIPQVLDTLVGEAPVVMSPGELLLDIATGLQGGQSFDHLNNALEIFELKHVFIKPVGWGRCQARRAWAG